MLSIHHLRCIVLVPLALVLAALVFGARQTAEACPFCSAPSLTLTEQVSQADAVVLVEWTSGQKPEGQQAGDTVYTIQQIVKGGESLKSGDSVTLSRYRAGKKGDLFLLFGTRGTVLEWGSPLEVTETSFQYIVKAPGPAAPPKERLTYFVKYLEFPDEMVANDAYGEFANAPYSDITLIKEAMPRERIRKWIANPETPVTRLGLYGLLLGLCGEEQDAELMRKKIAEQSDDFRLGIDGIISGYLLLTGEKGLDVVDQLKLDTQLILNEEGQPVLDEQGNPRKLPFSETYAAMQALRFMWQYAEGVIPPERLQQSMRTLLDRPELADLVIADLARWKDWSVQDRLMELYDEEAYSIPSIKRAVVRYMLVCANQKAEEGDKEPEYVASAKKHLETLEKNDPKTVSEAKRFFFLQ